MVIIIIPRLRREPHSVETINLCARCVWERRGELVAPVATLIFGRETLRGRAVAIEEFVVEPLEDVGAALERRDALFEELKCLGEGEAALGVGVGLFEMNEAVARAAEVSRTRTILKMI